MKKFYIIQQILFILILSFTAFSTNVSAQNPQTSTERQELVFLSWEDYIDPDLLKTFEARFHVKIRQVYFGSEDHRDELMIRAKGQGFDLLILSSITVPVYIDHQWITPLDFSQIPNSKYIDPRWQKLNPEIKNYIVPYLWGTYGIAYRKDLVQEEITSWRQLYQPSEALKGKIIMLKDPLEVIGLGLKSLGYSLNSVDPKEFAEVEKLLLLQKSFVRDFTYVDISEKSELVTGDVWMTPSYNGDALVIQEHNDNVNFVVPKEGTALWLDCLVIPKNSPKKKLALAFINFLHEPQNAAQLASYLYYATPNKAAKKFLTAEHLNNPAIYPNQEILGKSEFFRKLPAKVRRKWNTLFAKLNAQ